MGPLDALKPFCTQMSSSFSFISPRKLLGSETGMEGDRVT